MLFRSQEERRTHPGNRYEMWNMYIAGEVGGMGESLARLSEMVSAPEFAIRRVLLKRPLQSSVRCLKCP